MAVVRATKQKPESPETLMNPTAEGQSAATGPRKSKIVTGEVRPDEATPNAQLIPGASAEPQGYAAIVGFVGSRNGLAEQDRRAHRGTTGTTDSAQGARQVPQTVHWHWRWVLVGVRPRKHAHSAHPPAQRDT